MKTLLNPKDTQEVLQRLNAINSVSPRQWGRMSAHQMICHLSDGFRLYMGERTAATASVPFPRPALKWLAIWAPFPWPKGFQTMPELDQQAGGTPPAEFEKDTQDLRALIDRFVAEHKDFSWPARHPHFGSMSEKEWMRLAYLHADHHLRQFGA